jgi:hypothetical protein
MHANDGMQACRFSSLVNAPHSLNLSQTRTSADQYALHYEGAADEGRPQSEAAGLDEFEYTFPTETISISAPLWR